MPSMMAVILAIALSLGRSVALDDLSRKCGSCAPSKRAAAECHLLRLMLQRAHRQSIKQLGTNCHRRQQETELLQFAIAELQILGYYLKKHEVLSSKRHR